MKNCVMSYLMRPAAMVVLVGAWSLAAQVTPPGPQATYTGSWQNTTFGSSGPLSFSYELSDTQVTAVLDLGGFVFGGPPPGPKTFTGTLDPGGTVTFGLAGDDVFGDVSGSFDAAGNLTITMIAVPGFVRDATMTGSLVDPAHFSGQYRVDFETPTPEADRVEGIDFALGVVEATVVPEPGSGALLAIGLAWLLAVSRRRGR